MKFTHNGSSKFGNSYDTKANQAPMTMYNQEDSTTPSNGAVPANVSGSSQDTDVEATAASSRFRGKGRRGADDTYDEGFLARKLGFLDHVPTFREWVSDLWLDVICMAVVGAAALAMNTVNAVGGVTRKFIIWDNNGNFINPDIGYTRSAHNIIPIWLATLLSILIPSLFFVVSQIRVRSAYDLHVAFWGNIWAIIAGSLLQVFNKLLIGGVRPHFLDVCKPDPSLRPGSGSGFEGLYFDKSICTGTNERWINDALKSWPSGHTTVSFAGFVFASLYFNGKFKVFSDERPQFWKIVVFFLPPLGACLIGGAMILDHSHQWYDVFGGAVIGILVAFGVYRANYAAIWDFRFNHIPLPRPNSAWKCYPYYPRSLSSHSSPSMAAHHDNGISGGGGKAHIRGGGGGRKHVRNQNSTSSSMINDRGINELTSTQPSTQPSSPTSPTAPSHLSSGRQHAASVPHDSGYTSTSASQGTTARSARGEDLDFEYSDRGHFSYTLGERDRFADFAHGRARVWPRPLSGATGAFRGGGGGAPGDVVRM